MLALLLTACSLFSSPPVPRYGGHQLGHPTAYPFEIVDGELAGQAAPIPLTTASKPRGNRTWQVHETVYDAPAPVPGHLSLTWYSVVDNQFFRVDTDLDAPGLQAALAEATGQRDLGTPGDARRLGIDLYPGGKVLLTASDSYIVVAAGELQGQVVELDFAEALGTEEDRRVFRGQRLKKTRQAFLPSDRATELWTLRLQPHDYTLAFDGVEPGGTVGVRTWDRTRATWPVGSRGSRRLPFEAWATTGEGKIRARFDEEELFGAVKKLSGPFTLQLSATQAELVGPDGPVPLPKTVLSSE